MKTVIVKLQYKNMWLSNRAKMTWLKCHAKYE